MNLCKHIIAESSCTGCGVCQNICPVEAISMPENQEGFWYPLINEEKCINCGKCIRGCPILQNKEKPLSDSKESRPVIYASWSLDKDIRYHSTSGGVFSELALKVLEMRGYICGAVYDKRQRVVHFITNEKQELERIRQSKYVQSDMGNIYKEIGALLKQGKTMLFCGSPCQCAGLYFYLKEMKVRMENLYLIDFICRGSNSPKVYKKFLEELEDLYQANIKKIWFKNKTYGWNQFCTKIEFENGRYYLQDRYHDTYIRGYIEENLYIRPSCGNCCFKGFHRIADITLADFWGVQLEGQKQQDSDGGTSMVMLHTEKGKTLWDKISNRVFWEEKELEDIIPGNVCFYNSVQQGVHRGQFMENLDKISVIENIEHFLKKSNR